MVKGLLSENPFDDPDYEYTGPLSLAPFRQRKLLDIDETSDDGVEFALPGLLRGPLNAAARMGQMALGERPLGFILGDVMDFSPAGLLNRIPKNALGMNVFHGTPNLFKPEPGFPQGRPRLDKMGTGEGAQAYGSGFYSAQSRDVGRGYRDDLTQARRLQSLDGMPLPSASVFDAKQVARDFDIPEQDAVYLQQIIKDLDLSVTAGDMDSIIAKLKSQIDLYPKSDPDPETDEILKALRGTYEAQLAVANKYKDRIKPNSGFLYKLDIPDADAAKFLDFDAPLSAQPKSVRDALKAYGNYPDNMKGSQIYEAIASSLAKPPFDNTIPSTKNPSSAKAAADALREMGIPGLRYLDRGSRGVKEVPFVNGKRVTNKLDLVAADMMKIHRGRKSRIQAEMRNAKSQGLTAAERDEVMRRLDNFTADKVEYKSDPDATRNFVVWDQDVLDRTKVLQRNDEIFDGLLSPDRQTKVETSRRGNVLEINKIETPPEKRGQGFADKKLRELIEQADAEGLTLALTPSNAFGANKKRLENWYKRNGFVRNAGRNKDFTTKEAFIRPPKTTNLKAAPGVPAMGLLSSDNDNRPGGINLLGLYTGGVI